MQTKTFTAISEANNTIFQGGLNVFQAMGQVAQSQLEAVQQAFNGKEANLKNSNILAAAEPVMTAVNAYIDTTTKAITNVFEVATQEMSGANMTNAASAAMAQWPNLCGGYVKAAPKAEAGTSNAAAAATGAHAAPRKATAAAGTATA